MNQTNTLHKKWHLHTTAAITITITFAFAFLSLAAPAAEAASGQGGDITRTEVLARAQNWYDRGVQYDQQAEASDVDGAHDYRTDCSGLVAMAWHLPSTDYNTGSLDQRSVTSQIDRDDLLPGDALDNTDDGHVVIFTGWVVKGAGTFTYIQLANPRADMAKGTASFDSPLLAGLPTANYVALRYNHIVDDSASTRTPVGYPWRAPMSW
ncbi:hypothetical protein [Embleya sp. AB8]|uniref:hypothetical protein n=1 Tax=Embleya sp. AB8 TaxID=3156304 RepID=UPI003C7559E3